MTGREKKATGKVFRGFQGPNFTPVPDALFDELLPTLTGAELKVLLYIIRRTFGFKNESDAISLSQMIHGIVKRDGTRLDSGAGVSKRTLLGALRSLKARNIIFSERQRNAERGDRPSVYSLNVLPKQTPGEKIAPGGGAKLHQGGGAKSSPAPRGKKFTTQETEEQETVLQKTVSNFESSKVRNFDSAKGKPAANAKSSGKPRAGSEKQGLEAIGNVLERRGSVPAGKGQSPATLDEEYQKIQDYISDRANEFSDRAPLKSSTTRAWNLYKRSGLPVDEFVSRIYKARSLTLEGAGRSPKESDDPRYRAKPKKNRMAYFFAVLEDQLGLIDSEARRRTHHGQRQEEGAPEIIG